MQISAWGRGVKASRAHAEILILLGTFLGDFTQPRILFQCVGGGSIVCAHGGGSAKCLLGRGVKIGKKNYVRT